jgi:hypothetical protein
MFIASSAQIKKNRRSQINNLLLYLKEIVIQEQPKSKYSRRKEAIRSEQNK